MGRLKNLIDPFVVSLLTTVLLASLLPPHGGFARFMVILADIAIFALFFLHGAKLSREAILAGAGQWRLHLATLAATFVAFPLIGLAVARIPGLSPIAANGLLFLTLLPSTVQSSIAFTAIARGNVAAAVCSASFSNLLGIFVTPLLVAWLMGAAKGGGNALSWGSVGAILWQLFVPFLAGHLLRPWIGGFVARHRQVLTLVDRSSILLVVYSAFGAAVVEGIWHRLSVGALGVIALLCCVILAAILALTWAAGRALGFTRADRIVLLFCGSKKSLASGVPMAGVLFAPAEVGIAILPLMLFHQIQLFACALIARAYAAEPEELKPPP